jgi:hypothetical protein
MVLSLGDDEGGAALSRTMLIVSPIGRWTEPLLHYFLSESREGRPPGGGSVASRTGTSTRWAVEIFNIR